MKQKLKAFLSALLTAAMLAPMAALPSFAADGDEAAEVYTAPESPAVTYNMNLDWKFLDTKCTDEIWTAMAKADKNGKKFYEADYDDSAWETVSIPHAPGAQEAFNAANQDAGGGYRSVLLYRKKFTVPNITGGSKIFFELEGIRQSAYVWVNGREVGYYEAGIAPMGFDITPYVTPGQEAVIAICNDGATARGTTGRIPYETVPGNKWGSSYTPDNYKTTVGGGSQFVWNTKDFNEPVVGLVYDAYLHVKGSVYQTLPLYNNLKTTGTYIYADNYEIKAKTATIHVDAEVRNESSADGNYTVEVNVVDADGNLKYSFESDAKSVPAASDKGKVYQTATESDVYTDSKLEVTTELDGVADPSLLEMINDASKRPRATADKDKNGHTKYYTYPEKWTDWADIPSGFTKTAVDPTTGYRMEYRDKDNKSVEYTSANAKQYRTLTNVYQVRHNESFATEVITPEVEHITASFNATDMRFWSIDDPYLYTVYTILKDSSGNAVDVQKKTTGFRKISYDANSGILINDRAVWMPGYAQRSTNEWAVIGVSPDWLEDYDMALLKENNSNFIRWMHVAPKPFEVRSSDKYGVAVVCPAGDKEGVGLTGRQWAQRVEAMRDVMIYFRNSPSVVFWETGNSAVGCAENANEMAEMRDKLDAKGMRFTGARSTETADQLNYNGNYAGTMYGTGKNNESPKKAIAAMTSNGKMGPIMETEYARDESPRRVWDVYSPPDYDYVNKYVYKDGKTGNKLDNFDVWNLTQEDAVVRNVKEYNGYYSNRAGSGASIYSAAAMMVWSDSNMHTRNCGTENDRTSGRVDAVRQTKEMFEGTKAAQSSKPAVHIVGHWSYPAVSDDTYNYYGVNNVATGTARYTYDQYDSTKKLKRDPLHKTVYVIGSADISYVELYRVDGDAETLLGKDETADENFVYQFDSIDVTKGDAVIAKAYDARGTKVADDKIARTGAAAKIRLTPHTAVKADEEGNPTADWRADGADIAYVDVEVLDENNNVCVLNYDKINFEVSGTQYGTYLGGYNSGMGANCFQNTAASQGFSFYFGGAKDGVSTIGKNYVYAENGTNRIFIRSTREAGDFTLTAKMDGVTGPGGVSVTLTSTDVDEYVTGGLSTLMPATLSKELGDAPVTTNVPRMKPLMLSKLLIDWSKVDVAREVDNTFYYDKVVVDGEELNTNGAKTYIGTMDNIFGPLNLILEKLQTDGAPFTYTYSPTGSPASLTISSGGHTYTFKDGNNQVEVDNGADYDECVDKAFVSDGIMTANLSKATGYISGVTMTEDKATKTLTITYTAN